MSSPNKFHEALKGKRAPETATASTVAAPAAASDPERPSRAGSKHIGGYFDPAVSRQLRAMAAEEDSTVQDLLAEGLDLLFQSRQRPMIARRPAVGG